MLKLLSQKHIPKLNWSSPSPLNYRPKLKTLLLLILGLTLFGLGESLLITANIGVSPWIVLSQGVSSVTSLSVGEATFVVSVLVLFMWIPLKQLPGVGTLLNAIIIAAVIEFSVPFLPYPEHAINQVLQTIIGILIVGLGSGIYLISNLGAGPRDGLMTGLQKVTQLPISIVRTSIEVTVVVIGWSMGGVVGLGTVIFALGIGPSVSIALVLVKRLTSAVAKK